MYNESEPTFVLVVESPSSPCEWITDNQFSWAKILPGKQKETPPFLHFKVLTTTGKIDFFTKTWDENWEILNWLAAVQEGDVSFMGYDLYGRPTEDNPDEDGKKLIDHLHKREHPSKDEKIFSEQYRKN
jgi:hypothetical protein